MSRLKPSLLLDKPLLTFKSTLSKNLLYMDFNPPSCGQAPQKADYHFKQVMNYGIEKSCCNWDRNIDASRK